jgi:hypothetical protein
MNVPDASEIIPEILRTFAGGAPLSNVDVLFAPGLICYIDSLRFKTGTDGLKTWFGYIRAMMRRRHIAVNFLSYTLADDGPLRYKVSGIARISHADATEERRSFSVTYLIDEGKVQTVWSTKTNYIGIVGSSIALPLYVGVIFHCLRAWYYGIRGVS